MYNDQHQSNQKTPNGYQNPSYYQNTNPYTTPTTPGIYPSAPPMPPQKPHKKAWSWYKRQKNGTKLGVGCLSIIGLLFMCGLCSGFSSMAAGTNSAAQTGASPKITSQQVVQKSVSTAKVTPKPIVKQTATPMPKPTPTPKPVPTPRPVSTPTPRPVPTAIPTPIPVVPTPTPVPVITGVNGNPWGYDFNAGNLIYGPPANICDYFNCIASFWKSTNGYIDECYDGTYSHSGGRSGACSYHGGELRPLFSH